MGANARILKDAAPLPERRIPAAVHEADRRVREMVDAARAEAERIRSEAEAARDALRAAAEEEGRRDGLGRAAATLAWAEAERDRRLAALEPEVIALAVDVARKVLGREIRLDRSVVADLAARALASARDRREVILRVNPGDAPALRAREGSLGALLARAPLAVREDPAVPPGGAVVETEAGRVDAGIEAQLDVLARALGEALGP